MPSDIRNTPAATFKADAARKTKNDLGTPVPIESCDTAVCAAWANDIDEMLEQINEVFVDGAAVETLVTQGRVTSEGVTLSPGSTGASVDYVSAPPESTLTANPGSLALDGNGTFWIKASGTGNTGWMESATRADAEAAAEAFSSGLAARLTANGGVAGGNLARTTQVVMATNTGIVQIASAGDGNVVEVFADGANHASGTVLQRLFMKEGEVAVLTGLSAGAVITSTQGVCGASGLDNGGINVGPMPLAPEGFAARQFFVNAFRLSNVPGSGNGEGRVFVAAGAVPATVTLYNGAGTTVVDGPYELDSFGYQVLITDADAEFQVVASQPVFCAIGASFGFNAKNADLRLVPPLATELIGYNSNARVSALYDNTEVFAYRQNGTVSRWVISPGSPASIYTGTDADGGPNAGNTGDYAPAGALILRATGPISALTGADGSGIDATCFFPMSALSQKVPLALGNSGSDADDDANSIAFASPYEGTVTVYNQDGTVFGTTTMVRSTTPPTTAAQQLHPAAGVISIRAATTGAFSGGWAESDVPFYCVHNSEDNQNQFTGGMATEHDEVVMFGVTPEDTRAEIRKDANGMKRKRVIDGTGSESWTLV